MRIAPSFATTPVPAPEAPAPTPAEAWMRNAGWLLAAQSIVTGLVPIDATSVRVLVADPFVTDPHDKVEADHLAADSAIAVLEQAAHGVRLIPTTQLGYVGRMRELAPAQLTFATGLPGVQRHDLVRRDLNGDGLVAPGEVVHRIEVDGRIDVARVDWLLRDRFDEGVVTDGPVEVLVPEVPWRGPVMPAPLA